MIVNCFNYFPVSLRVKTRRKGYFCFLTHSLFLLQDVKGFQGLEELREQQGSQDLLDHLDRRVPPGSQDSPERLELPVVLGFRDFQEDLGTPAPLDL